jgi:hypothetical protein
VRHSRRYGFREATSVPWTAKEVDGARNPVVRTDMLLFLLIPLGLIACTIAAGPILAVTMVHEAEHPSAPVRVADRSKVTGGARTHGAAGATRRR